jgi:uncharacterized protein
LGWQLSAASNEHISFVRTGGVALALYPKEKLAEETGVPMVAGAGTFTLAHNVRGQYDVDTVLDQAQQAGAKLLKPAADTFWGGRSGYFADPDGHIWEVAWNPHFPFAADGSVLLP